MQSQHKIISCVFIFPVFVAALNFSEYSQCVAQEINTSIRETSTILLHGYISPIVSQSERGELNSEVSEFILDFTTPVDISAVEVYTDMVFNDDFVYESIKSISLDSRQWLMELYEPVATETWIDFITFQHNNRMEYDSLAVELKQDTIEIQMINDDVIVDGLAVTVEQLINQPGQSDTDVSIVEHNSKENRQSLRRSTGKYIQRVDSQRDLYNNYSLDSAFVRDEGGTVAVACCLLGGVCTVYGGTHCPSGTSPQACPCGWTE